MLFLWVALGGALGASMRHGLAVLGANLLGETFPWATLACNVAGSALIGWLAMTLEHDAARAFWMIGVLGGFTTFSSFSLQTLQLVEQGYGPLALAYVALSVALCLVGVTIGVMLARTVG